MLIYAITKDTEQFVHVNDVPNGKKCGCICPECKDNLTAKNNCKIKSNHFAHQYLDEGKACLMTQLHLAAQHYFTKIENYIVPSISFMHQGKRLTQAEQIVKVNSATLEKNVGNYYSDVMLQTEIGDIYIEIQVTHASTDEKIRFYKTNKLASIEYDLSSLKSFDVDTSLKLLAENSIKTKWFYEWCKDKLINEHLAEIEILAKKELLKQKQSAKKSSLKFIKNKYIILPSIDTKMQCEIQGHQFDKEVRLFSKQECQLDDIDIFSECDDYLMLKGIRHSNQVTRVIWVAYLYTPNIPNTIKELNDAVVVRTPSIGKGGKATWKWHSYPKLEQLKNSHFLKFIEQCKFDLSLKESTIENEGEIDFLANGYANNQDIYFKSGYGKWKSWLLKEGLFKASATKKNPSYPNLMKYHKTHPNLWMFDEWYVLVYCKMAQIIDSIPMNILINFSEVFFELSQHFPLHPKFHYLSAKVSYRFLDETKHDLIFRSEIIESSLRLFESELVIKINNKGIIRTGGLLRTLLSS